MFCVDLRDSEYRDGLKRTLMITVGRRQRLQRQLQELYHEEVIYCSSSAYGHLKRWKRDFRE